MKTHAVIYIETCRYARYPSNNKQTLVDQQLRACHELARRHGLTNAHEYVDSLTDPSDAEDRRQLLDSLTNNPKQKVIVASTLQPHEEPVIHSASTYLIQCRIADTMAVLAERHGDDGEPIIECPDPMLHSTVPAGKAGTYED